MPRDSYYMPERRLVSQDDAAMTERADVPRSKFVGRWTRLTTFDAGILYPIMLDEILPGDHMSYNVTAYVRMQTPLFPIFSNQRIDTHFFFVPARILWDNWKRFMGEQPTPGSSIAFTIPITNLGENELVVGSIYDHFGLPIGNVGASPNFIPVNALPFRAYARIYNDWFRDQNLTSSWNSPTNDGPDNPSIYALAPRNKFHDYFTSALPWPQKFTAPNIQLTGSPVVRANAADTNQLTAFSDVYGGQRNLRASSAMLEMTNTTPGAAFPLYVSLADVAGIPINTFRQAFLVQQLLERDARGGTRYTELIRSHFGVINPDFRLQRPEYIGGGSSPLQVTPIAQTAPGGSTTVGALGGTGTSVGNHRASYAATEHGYIIGLISVRTELAYQQGVHKMWSRQTRYDFYFPSTAGLGEQAILRQEIYAVGSTGVPTSDHTVFGYQERWHELRQRHSEVTGYMRSTVAGTLDNWHLVQEFATAPVLDDAFIQDNPPMERILAAGELAADAQYLADILFERTAVRPIPTFGTPVTLGRF